MREVGHFLDDGFFISKVDELGLEGVPWVHVGEDREDAPVLY